MEIIVLSLLSIVAANYFYTEMMFLLTDVMDDKKYE